MVLIFMGVPCVLIDQLTCSYSALNEGRAACVNSTPAPPFWTISIKVYRDTVAYNTCVDSCYSAATPSGDAVPDPTTHLLNIDVSHVSPIPPGLASACRRLRLEERAGELLHAAEHEAMLDGSLFHPPRSHRPHLA